MHFLDNEYKRKSALITSVILVLFVVCAFFFGLTYWDPPKEFGISVNFGTSDVGMGTIQPTEPLKSAPQVVKDKNEEIVREKVKPTSSKITEEVLTQNTEDAIVIKKQLEAKKKADEELRKQREQQQAIAKQKADEAAKKKNLDALVGGIKNANGTATGGEGDDNLAGDKGKIDGDPNAKGYYGSGGIGGGGDYQLGNRKPLNKPTPNYICDEVGIVVVQIEVDRNGRVINAVPGVKGTTNSAECLKSEAKIAALKTTWQPDSNATSKQVGYIRYRFSISQ